MSIRAHRIKKIVHAGESFNLMHDRGVVRWLREHTDFFEQLNIDGCGVAEVLVDDMEALIEEVGLERSLRKKLEEDVKEAKRNGDSVVMYYCF